MSRNRIFLSVSILLAFSHPSGALPGTATGAARDEASRLHHIFPEAEVQEVLLPDQTGGPSFHQDYLISRGDDPLLLVVVAHPGDEELLLHLSHLADSRLALLLTAPRHKAGDGGRIAAGLPQVAPDIPRIFLAPGPSTEWRVAVPGGAAPLWLVQAITAADFSGLNTAQLNAARLGYGLADPPLDNALREGVPAARLFLETPRDLSRTIPPLLDHLQSSREAFRQQDINYLILPLPRPVIIDEFTLVRILVGLALVLLLYSVSFPRRTLHYLRSMGHNMPAIFVSLLVILGSLVAANLAIRAILRLFPHPPPPTILVAGKISAVCTALGIMATTLRHRLRRATAVYSGTAVLLLLVGAIASGLTSLVMGAYFTVSFFFGVLFSLGHRAWIKMVTLIFALTPLVYLIAVLTPAADLPMITALLTPPLYREALTAAILLPALLMFFRLDAIASRIPLVPLLTMTATVGLALTAATMITHFQKDLPLPLRVTEEFSLGQELSGPGHPDGELSLTGHRSITSGNRRISSEVTILVAGEEPIRCKEIPCQEDLFSGPAPPLQLHTETSRLLDRHSLHWSVEFQESAETLDISFEANQPIQLYASDHPMKEPVGSRHAHFSVQTGPLPPQRTRGTLVFRADTLPVTITTTATSSFSLPASILEDSFYLSPDSRSISGTSTAGSTGTGNLINRDRITRKWTLYERATLE
ncbi:hypothetical protein SAMN05920897_101169 [Alkalispirochaeta americana]|uniref:Uncharacterized protein n=1 Tax=Alkalispirochaeta americana TaxID=159291 RepID=A0A1N6NBF9_9SPIO|nr:hypothetical protein [Alkalispirochaeta americana]SIP89386.1 hypothetical protein SAMN05920897_101169 [Alkalispirochaeta americana]